MSQDTPTAYARRYVLRPRPERLSSYANVLQVWAVNSAGKRLTLEAEVLLWINLEIEERTIDREQRLAEVWAACPMPEDTTADRLENARRLSALTWLAADVGLRDFGPSRPIT